MADEPAVEETAVEEGDTRAIVAGEGGAKAEFMRAALEAICGKAAPTLTPQKLRLFEGSPGSLGNTGTMLNKAPDGTDAITWGTATGGGTPGGTVASISATPIVFSAVTPGTYTHYAVYGGAAAPSPTTYLYSKRLSAQVVIPTGATGTITVTASHTYDLT